jgi:hypothetical protein
MSLDLAFKAYTRCAVEEGTSTLLHFGGYSVGKSLGKKLRYVSPFAEGSPRQRDGALFGGEGANMLTIWRAIEQAKRMAGRVDERWAEALK